MAEERRIDFTGTGFQALGWGLLAVLLSFLIIPAAWGAAALYRWFVRNLSFSFNVGWMDLFVTGGCRRR